MKQIDQNRKENISKIFIIGTVLLSVFIMEITMHLLFHETTLVLSHLFYFPIILVAALWPERGIIASTALSLVYLILIYILVFPDMNDLVAGTMQFYVYVSVGIAISMITGRIKTSEMKYQRLFQYSGSGAVLTDAHTGDIIEANEQYYEMTGAFRDGQDKTERVICPDKNWMDCLEHLKNKGTITNHETSIQKDNKHLDLLISAGMVSDDQIIVTITDITERKKAELELKQRNEQLYVMNQVVSAANSSENADECLNLAINRVLELLRFEGGVIYLSDTNRDRPEITASITQENAEESLLSYLQNTDITDPPYSQALEEGTPVFRECTDSEKNNLTFSSAAIPLISREKTVGVMLVAGRREHHFTEEEKDLLGSIGRELGNSILLNLMYSNTESARTEANFYLDVMMHDINNANTASLGYGEILCDYVGETEKPIVGKILSSVRQSTGIIKNVRSVRDLRSDGLRTTGVNLGRAIIQAADREKISVETPDADIMVLADSQLTDVFSRLLENSRLHGGKGDKISVSIRVEETEDEVLISVEDDGRGLSDIRKQGLFMRFFSGRKSAGGKGISLSICRMIIEEYGGKIWAEDRIEGQPEGGLAVRFSLRKA